MFKINSYSLFLLGLLFVNNLNVRLFSSSRFNHNSNTPEQSLFPSIYNLRESANNIPPLFPISSVTPQLYNWPFNSSTHTFVPIDWDPNNSTNAFNTNHFSLPITHESEDFNHAFMNANNSTSLLILDDPISSNTTDVSVHTNNNPTPSVALHVNEDKNDPLEKNNKKKRTKKTYTCPKCNRILASQRSLNYHVKTHDLNRAKPHQCHICHKSYAEKFILKNHIKRHNKEKSFKCDFCSMCFKTKHEKLDHHRTHTGEKPYQCLICDKWFATKSSFQYHKRAHTGEKPYTCDICQKGLASKQSLENHLNKHSGKKPYSCEECNKSFRQKTRLKEHRKLHENKKPYKCTICSKSYSSKTGYNRHTKLHNNSQSYTCKYCRANFVYKSEYEDHIKYEEETDEERKCHICKKVYADKYKLKRHNKKLHSEI